MALLSLSTWQARDRSDVNSRERLKMSGEERKAREIGARSAPTIAYLRLPLIRISDPLYRISDSILGDG